ncbi:hypothetical protein DH2020_009674 [Rehmannia glutinosa]|uniref:PROP1-like PPR domain-containing protein n=1 Tax=Rehmannia glutinosa TaxID=99300 RepID=A0ABR0X888_REHGL
MIGKRIIDRHSKSTYTSTEQIRIIIIKQTCFSVSSGEERAKRFFSPCSPFLLTWGNVLCKTFAAGLSKLCRNKNNHQSETKKEIQTSDDQQKRYSQHLGIVDNKHLCNVRVHRIICSGRRLSAPQRALTTMVTTHNSGVEKSTFSDHCTDLDPDKGPGQISNRVCCHILSVIKMRGLLNIFKSSKKKKASELFFQLVLICCCLPWLVKAGNLLVAFKNAGFFDCELTMYSSPLSRDITMIIAQSNFEIAKLHKLNGHLEVMETFLEMLEAGVAPNHFTYTVVISSFVKGGMAEEALKTFNEMKNLGFVPEESTYSLLISLSSKNGDKDKAIHLYEDMRSVGIVPSNFTCASLLALYYRTADYSKACSLFTEMERYGVIADEVIYGLMIRIYGKLGLYEDAQKTFSEIERSGKLSDEKTYATMAQVHLNFGNFEKALDLMEQMKSNKISFSRFSYIVLLQCYIVKGDLASAEVAYQSLSKSGLPDATSCKDMLNLYLRIGLPEKAKNFVDQIRKDQIEFDEALFMTVMKVYCKGGMLREVEQLIEELSVSETFKGVPFVQTFFAVMNGQCNGLYENRFEALDQSGTTAVELMLTLCDMLMAKYLYEIMIKLGCGIEDAARASMISLYGKQKKLKQAEEVFIAVAGSATDLKAIYSSMIDAYITCGREKDAYLFYKEQTRKGHNLGAVSISKLVKALTSCGKYCEADEVIRNSFHENLELDTVAYNTCIKAMLEAGKLRSAINIYERMLSLKISPLVQTYNTMISVYGRGRNLDKVVEMFNMAQGMGVALDEKTYTNMICHYGKAGKVHEASALFSKMQEEGIKPGQMSYNIMINVYAADGLYIEAEKLLLSMQKNGCSPDSLTYLAIIRAYTKGSKYPEAEKTIMSMQEEGIPLSCAHFNLLLSAFTKTGLMVDADRIYQKIFSTGLNPDLESKSIMLRGYLDFGHVEEGIYFFEKECCSIGPDRFILSAAVHLYRSAGKEVQAKEVLNSMNNLGISFLNNLKVGSKTKPT